MNRSPFLTSLLVALVALAPVARAAEPFFRSGDIVALAGGEEMVAAAEAGELELAIATAETDLHLTFRSLAWEGDTVYDQRRDLNYPPLEDQLAKMHATTVLLQFGQMECLGGKGKLPEFIVAYEKLLDRLAGAEGRRLLLILPHPFTKPEDPALPDLTPHNADVDAYAKAIRELAQRRSLRTVEWTLSAASGVTVFTRDGIHLNAWGEAHRAQSLAEKLCPEAAATIAAKRKAPEAEKLLRLIAQKNRLWFNYYRPQNWAFLAGDRVNQPSSHDHLDPSKRWFPGEMEQYVPLIEKKDREIWDAASALQAKGK